MGKMLIDDYIKTKIEEAFLQGKWRRSELDAIGEDMLLITLNRWAEYCITCAAEHGGPLRVIAIPLEVLVEQYSDYELILDLFGNPVLYVGKNGCGPAFLTPEESAQVWRQLPAAMEELLKVISTEKEGGSDV